MLVQRWCAHDCLYPPLLAAGAASGAGEQPGRPLNDPVQGSSPGGPFDDAGAVALVQWMRSTALAALVCLVPFLLLLRCLWKAVRHLSARVRSVLCWRCCVLLLNPSSRDCLKVSFAGWPLDSMGSRFASLCCDRLALDWGPHGRMHFEETGSRC